MALIDKDTVELMAETLAHRMEVSEAAIEYANKPQTEVFRDMARRAIHALSWVRVAAELLKEVEHEWPATWWDAFKLRWFPAWALKRWPARMAGCRLEAKALYPEIAFPERRHTLSLTKYAWDGLDGDA